MATLTFSNSMVQRFWEAWTAGDYRNQRVGQAFYNHFNMHKVSGDKLELNKLYELDGQAARAWIANHTDPEN